MEGYKQQSGRSTTGGEPEHEMSSMKKYGHVAQSRSVQRSHALPRSSSRPKSRPKSRGESRSGSRGKMRNSPPAASAVSDEEANNNNGSLKRSGSLKRCSSWSMIRDGKIDERGRCRRHPNIELCRSEAINSNAPWRMLLQDCPLCSLHDSGLNCNNDYTDMIRKDSITLSGEITAQTGGTATTPPSSGEETSVDSDTSNNHDNIINKREKVGPPPPTTKQQHAPPPPQQHKRSSVQTLKALGKMHMDADDAASISARSNASRRSRHPPPPPPGGRNPYSTPNQSSHSKKGSNASISSLSTKELSRLRKERYSSEGNDERIAELKIQQNSERDESAHHDIGNSLERLRAERKAAKDRLTERRKSGRSHGQRERSEESSSETFTLPMNDVGRGRAATTVRDDDILGAAAEIRSRARRSLSRSKERKKAAEDMFGTASIIRVEHTVDGDAVSVSPRGRRSIMNPHGLADPPRPLPVQRRSQSRERRRSRSGGRTVDGGGGLERQRYDATIERSSEVLINRRREMRQRLAERQNAADHRRVGSAPLAGDNDCQSVKDEVIEDWTRETRRSGRSVERSERGRGRSRSRVRDGLSKIRSASLNAFRKKDKKKVDNEEQTVDSGRMSFRSLVSQGSRLRSRSRGRRVKTQGDFDIEAFSVSDHGFDALSMAESDIGERRKDSGSNVGRFSNTKTAKVRQTRRNPFRHEDEFDGLGDENYYAHMSPAPGRPGAFEV